MTGGLFSIIIVRICALFYMNSSERKRNMNNEREKSEGKDRPLDPPHPPVQKGRIYLLLLQSPLPPGREDLPLLRLPDEKDQVRPPLGGRDRERGRFFGLNGRAHNNAACFRPS